VYNGLLHTIRLLVEAENMDFGDVWGIFVAHYRTWDFGSVGTDLAFREEEHLSAIKVDKYVQPPIPNSVTLEGRKTTVELNPTTGTNGVLIAGPSGLRPGPFGWNCLTARGVQANRFVAVTISWDEGMGFQANTNPSTLPGQQSGCDNDKRFYNSMVVIHNNATGKRRYWKLKGKRPSTIYVGTGNEGPVTLHILLVPTPPTDYVGGRHFESNTFMSPIPIYSYKYALTIFSSLPATATLASEAARKDDGTVAYDASTRSWWPVKCTCIDNPTSKICVSPKFKRVGSSFCFSGSTTVEVKGKGTVAMADLFLGDEVLTSSGMYDTVYSFGHRHETTEAEFLQFLPSNLEISKNHMIKVGEHYIPASAVQAGDALETAAGEMVIVESIERVTRKGVYAPFTTSGTIVVNNIKVSSYVAFQDSEHVMLGTWAVPLSYQWIAHMSQAPHRVWVRMLGVNEETYTIEGMSTWIDVPHRLAEWYLDQKPVLMVILLVPTLALLMVVSAGETMLSWLI
jgi:hypothetical protein